MDYPPLLPTALVGLAFACCCFWHTVVDATTLLCLCLLSVSISRLLQSFYLRRQRGADTGPAPPVRRAATRAEWVAGTTSVVLVIFVLLLSPGSTWDMLVTHWYLLVTTLLLPVAFEVSGTPRAELADALCETQTNYSAGAAWLFFLGYLEKIFGENGTHFARRMDDYMCVNAITSEESQRNTCKTRMFILVPMRRAAILSDKDFEANDPTVKKESTLGRAAQEGGRNYGETRVYQVDYNRQKYRLAMEEATPLRTASLAVEDADAEFDEDDYYEFAGRFLKALQNILLSKPAIGAQLELVPIEESNQLGSTVVKRFLALRQLEEEGRLGGRAAEGSVAAAAARHPEEGSEVEFASAAQRPGAR